MFILLGLTEANDHRLGHSACVCMHACVRVWVPDSRCQCCDFTFYCIVNAGILFVYYIYITIMYICVLVWFCGISFVFLHRFAIDEFMSQSIGTYVYFDCDYK